MSLAPEGIASFTAEYPKIHGRLEWLNLHLLIELAPTLKIDKAREYLQHGVCRRLKTIDRCLVNVFTIYPPARTDILNSAELNDVMINLQAFIMNVYGLTDNVAWVYILEQRRENTIKGGRQGIGLFDRRTQEHLSQRMRDYLSRESMQAWFGEYSKNFRDALAHRIPPYVPPYLATPETQKRWEELDAASQVALREHRFDDHERLMSERDASVKPCPLFRHSYSDSDGTRALILHGQLLTDALTVVELMETVMEDVKASGWGAHTSKG
ncbi:MAG TPA: hypothetical protein VFB08_02210 [Burkholderiales bacterium]|nr:hypothetical protein [Burkholderiales bacterium]